MKDKKWGTKTDKKLEQIAMTADFALKQRGGLDIRRNDSEDFIELSVWGIQDMLRKAYELGRKEGGRDNG